MTDHPTQKPRPRALSGMRPTGKLHLGNYVGALRNWVKLQDTHDCFFFVADWHALTTDYDDTSRLADNTREVIVDFLAAGLDPQKCTIFVQSHVLQHAELHVLFSMITPLGWLERVPSFKEQQQQMPNKDLHMYGFLGYPLLQAADILVYRPDFVPVGQDQSAHVELTREVARRFNQFYKFEGKPVFPEPQVLLTPSPMLLGTDKRKMSKSYGNTILLSDERDQLFTKIGNSVTDRPKLSDHGNPDRCPVGNLHQIFSNSTDLEKVTLGCTQATIRCVDCKAWAALSVEAELKEIRDRRHDLDQNRGLLEEIIQHGAQKATAVSETTMVAARRAVGLLNPASLESAPNRFPFLIPGVPQDSDFVPLRVPEIVNTAKTEEEKWDIRVNTWWEQVNKIHPLKKDRRGVFITRKGRKVGVHAAEEGRDGWNFEFEDRPVNVMVLLAEDKDRYLHPYVLPPKFLQEHWKFGGFTDRWIRKISGVAVLAVGADNISIQEYEGDYSALQ